MRYMTFAVAMILLVVATATAQRQADSINSDAQPPLYYNPGPDVNYTSVLDGIETAPGVVSKDGTALAGITYSMDVSGPLSGHFTVVLDAVGGRPNSVSGNQISRGTWTLAVYKDGIYQGTLFGEVANGMMDWKRDGKAVIAGVIDAELTVKGGTKEISNVIGEQAYGTFSVFWQASPKGSEGTPPTLSGKLELTF